MIEVAFIYAIIAAGQYAIIGIAFLPVLDVTKIFNITQGSVFAVSGYITLLLMWNGAYFPLAAIAGILIGSFLGISLDFVIHSATKGALKSAGLIGFLVSLGLYLIMESVIAIAFGDEAISLRLLVPISKWKIGTTFITTPQALMVIGAFVGAIGLTMIYMLTGFGRRLRALAENPFLAQIFGIRPNLLRYQALAIGSCLMSLAGLLHCLDTDLRPTMGFHAVIAGAVAAVLAGKRGPLGAAIIGAFLGATNSLIVWIYGGRWQGVFAYGILLVICIWRGRILIAQRSIKQTI